MNDCRNCGCVIVGRSARAVFCSNDCKMVWDRARASEKRKKNSVLVRCKTCSQEITGRCSRAKYCSVNCQRQRNYLVIKAQTAKKFSTPVACKGCGMEFFRSLSGKKIFCTDGCKSRYHSTQNRQANRWKRIEKEYGITRFDWEQLMSNQNGACAICTVELRMPHTDHDHKTGRVRGLLCQKCNQAIGLMMESPENLMRAARYLS